MKAAASLASFAVAVVMAGCGSAQDKQAASLHAALHPIAVSDVQARLRRAADRGASNGRLLALTNELVDVIRDDTGDQRRGAIDDALATLDSTGCSECIDALENARG